ncbi:MAG TPA: RNA 2',3'-cyclic phosphodiesterase [Candidatus Polarisedimenticolaceae bacterium]|nr:RNA 2',3'-cyclic phosphodiesterase [Candidatus Polarisedimenticolaceae bacterium]
MRLFLALEPPPGLRAELQRLREALERSTPGWRWIRAESVHLTLRFLGEVDASREAAARGAGEAAAAEAHPLHLELHGVGCFPNPRRPRVLWVGIEETRAPGALAALAAGLETAARQHGFPPETRAFRPHLTLARAGPAGWPTAPRVEFRGTTAWAASELVLYQSELHPAGARYTRRAVFPLGGA